MGPDQSCITIINNDLELEIIPPERSKRRDLFIVSFDCKIYLKEITHPVIKPRQFTKSNF